MCMVVESQARWDTAMKHLHEALPCLYMSLAGHFVGPNLNNRGGTAGKIEAWVQG